MLKVTATGMRLPYGLIPARSNRLARTPVTVPCVRTLACHGIVMAPSFSKVKMSLVPLVLSSCM